MEQQPQALPQPPHLLPLQLQHNRQLLGATKVEIMVEDKLPRQLPPPQRKHPQQLEIPNKEVTSREAIEGTSKVAAVVVNSEASSEATEAETVAVNHQDAEELPAALSFKSERITGRGLNVNQVIFWLNGSNQGLLGFASLVDTLLDSSFHFGDRSYVDIVFPIDGEDFFPCPLRASFYGE